MHQCRSGQFNCQKPVNKKAGFSLMELLVVLSVMAILTTIGLVSFLNYNRTQILTTASRDLRNNLRFAQNKAIVGEKPPDCTTLSAYYLVFTSETEYEIHAVCSDIDQKTIAKFKLPQGVKKTAGSDIHFKIASGGLSGSDITITLTSNFGGTENIVITQNGVIQ